MAYVPELNKLNKLMTCRQLAAADRSSFCHAFSLNERIVKITDGLTGNDSQVFAYSCLTTDRARSVKGALAATLVAQLHAVVQQFLFLSQARVHVGRKCVEVCVRERETVRLCGRKLAACFNCWH